MQGKDNLGSLPRHSPIVRACLPDARLRMIVPSRLRLEGLGGVRGRQHQPSWPISSFRSCLGLSHMAWNVARFLGFAVRRNIEDLLEKAAAIHQDLLFPSEGRHMRLDLSSPQFPRFVMLSSATPTLLQYQLDRGRAASTQGLKTGSNSKSSATAGTSQ